MGRTKLTIEQMQALAQEKNGVCLSKRYVNAVTTLRWRCAEGHEWEAVPSSVKQGGTWCPVCARKLQGPPCLTIEQMQVLAQEQKGVCLSTTYVDSKAKLRWRCEKGHEWEASPGNVKQGTWCPECAETFLGTIDQMQTLAREHDGVCLSTVYVNQSTKLRWCCSEGHEWEASPGNVKNRGSWCPECADVRVGLKRSSTIEQMQARAQERNGKCLSTTYVNAGTNLRWRCAEGHEWEATPRTVMRSWCPTCSQGNSERIVRDICEQLFGKQFPKDRPKWLVNSRGNQMELDGYCKKLSLAFEYQGRQHYEPSSFFHTGLRTLDQRTTDDARKRQLCRANGVHLIAIPYTVELDDVPVYIFAAVKDLNVPVRMRRPEKIKVAQFVLTEQLRSMQLLAQKQKGVCLSTTYVDSKAKLRWRCAEGHEWEAVPSSVQQGTWCPMCAGKLRGTIEKMQALAQEKNGVCLSTTYVDSRTNLRWRCAEGHEWEASPGKVKFKTWCPMCWNDRREAIGSANARRLTIEQMQALAQERNGKCLSTTYVNLRTNLRWECAEGHQWLATPDMMKQRVKKDYWCLKCPRVAQRRAPA